MRRLIADLNMPPGYTFRMNGQTQILDETTANLIMAIGLASIFVYIVLAAQFESFVQPIIIMLVLPVSVPFALFTIWATGRTLNLWSALGILLLFGIVKKNSILQVDYTNVLRARGRAAPRSDRRGVPHAAAADPHDDLRDHRRPGADGARHRHRRQPAVGDRDDDHRRPGRSACSSRCCWCRSRTCSSIRSNRRSPAAEPRPGCRSCRRRPSNATGRRRRLADRNRWRSRQSRHQLTFAASERASEPRERRAPAQRRARERVGSPRGASSSVIQSSFGSEGSSARPPLSSLAYHCTRNSCALNRGSPADGSIRSYVAIDENVGALGIAKVGVEDHVADVPGDAGVADEHQRFDAAIEIPLHQVRASQVHLRAGRRSRRRRARECSRNRPTTDGMWMFSLTPGTPGRSPRSRGS